MKRTILKMAWLPTFIDGRLIWLKKYLAFQEFQTVLVHESAGWPDIGEWVEEEQWVTINKKMINHS